MFSCKVLRMDGVDCKRLIPSEALTASKGGMEAEKTNEGPLMIYESKVSVCLLSAVASHT